MTATLDLVLAVGWWVVSTVAGVAFFFVDPPSDLYCLATFFGAGVFSELHWLSARRGRRGR